MSYSAFLVIFLLIPILVLSILLRHRIRRTHCQAAAVVCLLAFLWTTPWDNYAAAKGLWRFDHSFVLGYPFWFGSLPLEEYLFYFAEAIFVCLVVVGVRGYLGRDLPPGRGRVRSL